jgi:hypothetical protein
MLSWAHGAHEYSKVICPQTLASGGLRADLALKALVSLSPSPSWAIRERQRPLKICNSWPLFGTVARLSCVRRPVAPALREVIAPGERLTRSDTIRRKNCAAHGCRRFTR